MSQTVLLVDDDLNILRSFERIFRNENYEIRLAASAEEALRILHRESIDLLISDLKMPGMKGADLLAKTRLEFPDTIRFVLSGNATFDSAMEAIEKGEVARLFKKPVNLDELSTGIREALERKTLIDLLGRLLKKVRYQNRVLEKAETDGADIQKYREGAARENAVGSIPRKLQKLVAAVEEALEENQNIAP